MTDTLRDKLLRAQIGSCSCDTKTPELSYHDPSCRYRLLCEVEKELRIDGHLAKQLASSMTLNARLKNVIGPLIVCAEQVTDDDGSIRDHAATAITNARLALRE